MDKIGLTDTELSDDIIDPRTAREGGSAMAYLAAVCTSDGREVDLHFGQTERFLMIRVDEETGIWEELEYRETLPREGKAGHDSDWLHATARLLADAAYVWARQIGPKPHRILLAEGISALEVPTDIAGAVKAVGAYRKKRPTTGVS